MIDRGPTAASPPREMSVSQANLYMSREVYDAYLPDVVSIALIARDDKVMIVPLTRESGGGLLLKQRNARGDRVIHAQEFFREKGFLEDFVMRTVPIEWKAESAALVLSGIAQTPKED